MPRIRNTKDVILNAALELFSQRGYDSTGLRDIAKLVGIRESSLYKHFKSKEDIFNAIIDDVKSSFEKMTASLQIDGVDAQKDKDFYLEIGNEKIVELCTSMFLYYLHDEKANKFRKMLTMEQYRNKSIAAEYAKQYIDFPLQYQNSLFDIMIKSGASTGTNPEIMALQYYAPVYMYIAMCDIYPEREPEAVKALQEHFSQFMRQYSKTRKRKNGIWKGKT